MLLYFILIEKSELSAAYAKLEKLERETPFVRDEAISYVWNQARHFETYWKTMTERERTILTEDWKRFGG